MNYSLIVDVIITCVLTFVVVGATALAAKRSLLYLIVTMAVICGAALLAAELSHPSWCWGCIPIRDQPESFEAINALQVCIAALLSGVMFYAATRKTTFRIPLFLFALMTSFLVLSIRSGGLELVH